MRARKSATDKTAKTTEWLVYRVGGPKATFLGHVTASNRQSALAEAFDEFDIVSPRDRLKIIVQQKSRIQ